MSEKYTIDNIAKRMAMMGYVSSSTNVSTTGEYLVEDAMWNTMDLRHADKLHPQVAKNSPFFVDHHICCYVIHIKVLGVAVPIIGMTYLVNERALGAVLNLPFGFLVKSDIECTQDSETKTTVRVCYTILSHRFLKFMHGLIALSLKSNFKLLMKDDVPMRERRMELRRMGFHSIQDQCSFLNPLDISRNNIRFDRDQAHGNREEKEISISLDELGAGSRVRIELTPEKSFFIIREKQELLVFPSYCPHEGAKLDGAQCQNERVICPWHGRRLDPLCRFEMVDGADKSDRVIREISEINVEVIYDGHRLQFRQHPA